MNGLPWRSLGPHGWQPAGDCSPQLEQFICCNYWEDTEVGLLGQAGNGAGTGQAQRYIHTLEISSTGDSRNPQTSHPRLHSPTLKGACANLSRDTYTHLELTQELSDGSHTWLMWQKAARGTAVPLGTARCHSIGEIGL